MTPNKRKPGRPRSGAKATPNTADKAQTMSAKDLERAEVALSKVKDSVDRLNEKLAAARQRASDNAAKAKKSRSVTAKNAAATAKGNVSTLARKVKDAKLAQVEATKRLAVVRKSAKAADVAAKAEAMVDELKIALATKADQDLAKAVATFSARWLEKRSATDARKLRAAEKKAALKAKNSGRGRKRGRPAKIALAGDGNASQLSDTKPRGRPRKTQAAEGVRRRGRPKKNS